MDLQGIDLGIDGVGDGADIGVGASAAVYRATQLDLDRQVAVKVLTVVDADFVRRFEREARVLGKLSQNPGVVTIYDTGVTRAGQPYLILELCDSSLLEQLQDNGPLDPAEAAGIIGEVAGAVAAAHELGVIHRDLKPANVLRTQGGRYLVTDFGISVVSGATAGQTNSVGFTAGYVAPETLSGGSAGPEADVYALGASLFQLVSGYTAFTDPTGASNLMALVQRIAYDPVPDLRGVGVPEDVCQAIEWAMAKDPADRPTAAQLNERLKRVAQGLPVPAIERPPAAPPRLPDGGPLLGEQTILPAITGTIEPVSAPTSASLPGAQAASSGRLGPASSAVGPDTPTMFEQVTAKQDRQAKVRARTRVLAMAAAVVLLLAGSIVAVRALFYGDDTSVAATGTDEPAGPGVDAGAGSGLFTPLNDPAGPPELQSGIARVAPVSVPGLIDLSRDEAEELLADLGLRVNVVLRASTEVPVGTVIGQDPAEGVRVPGRSSINLIVAVREATEEIEVPSVAGSTVEQARIALTGVGLAAGGTPLAIYHDTIESGMVAGTDPPAGSPVNVGSEIALFVSLGRPTVPDLVGRTRQEAEIALETVSFTARIVVEADDDVAPGLVIRTTPAAGTVMDTGSEVDVVISGVPGPCVLPSVRNLTVAAARAELTTAGCPEPQVISVADDVVAGGLVVSVVFEGDPPVPVLRVSTADCAAVAVDQVGRLETTARAAIVAAGCTVGDVAEVLDPDQVAGTVASAAAVGQQINMTVTVTRVTCTIPDVAGLTVAAARTLVLAAGCELVVTAEPGPDTLTVVGTNPGPGVNIAVEEQVLLLTEVAAGECDYGSLVGLTGPVAVAAVEAEGCTAVVTAVPLPPGDPDIGLVVAHDPGPVPADSSVAISVGATSTTTSSSQPPTSTTTQPTGTVPTTGGPPTTSPVTSTTTPVTT